MQDRYVKYMGMFLKKGNKNAEMAIFALYVKKPIIA